MRGAVIAAVTASGLVFIALLAQAFAIRENPSMGIVREVSIAWFRLIRIHKESAGPDGFTLVFQILPGLGWYYLAWISAGLSPALAHQIRRHR